MTALELARLLGPGRSVKARLVVPLKDGDPAPTWEVRVLQVRKVLLLIQGAQLDACLMQVASWAGATPPAAERKSGMALTTFVALPEPSNDTIAGEPL